MITNDQLRMARAALRLNITDLAKLAGINKGTIVRIEAGFGAHPLTLKQLQEVLEIAGVIFIEADDNAGPGVRLKLGAEIPQRAPGEGAEPGEAGEGGMKASWDDFDEDANLDALQGEESALNPGMAEYWATAPDLWASLSEGGRETLSRTMFGDRRATGKGYFRNSDGARPYV